VTVAVVLVVRLRRRLLRLRMLLLLVQVIVLLVARMMAVQPLGRKAVSSHLLLVVWLGAVLLFLLTLSALWVTAAPTLAYAHCKLN
tara:strand:+ start:220 stop:477 length:258 start_codon:yes stop_codon:yes gene_type:complete